MEYKCYIQKTVRDRIEHTRIIDFYCTHLEPKTSCVHELIYTKYKFLVCNYHKNNGLETPFIIISYVLLLPYITLR